MNNKKALITGMVGSHLTGYLLDKTDFAIHGLCRWRSSLDNISHLLPRKNSEDSTYRYYADLRDYQSLQHVAEKVKPDYVFHLAVQSYSKTSFTSPDNTLDTNIMINNNFNYDC